MSRFGKRIGETEHQYVTGRLSAYLDDELPPAERSAVERHLATCQSCQWDLATLQQSVQWTRELPTIPLPRAFTIPAPAQPRRAARRRWAFLPLLQGATALVALLLFFVVAGDVMFTGLLPSSAPRPLDQQEQAAPAVAATQVVEEALQVEAVVEKEAEVAVEKAVAEPPQAPEPASAMPTEGLLLEQPVAATATPVVEATQAVGGGAQEEKEGEMADETRAAELPPAPAAEGTRPQPSQPTRQLRLTRTLALSSTPGVTAVITGAVAVEVRPTLVAPTVAVVEPATAAPVEPTLATAPTSAPEPAPGDAEKVVEAEAGPTAIVSAPSPESPAVAEATTVARIEEPVRSAPAEQEQGGLLDLPVPAVAWLRVTEAVLATALVLLGVTTVVIMLLQREAR